MGSTEQKNEANVAIITGGTVSGCFFLPSFFFRSLYPFPTHELTRRNYRAASGSSSLGTFTERAGV